MEVIKQGAEAKLYLGEYNGEHCLIKERFKKNYRHPELDEQLIKQRMKAETKTAARCLSAAVMAPTIFHMDLKERRIYMEYFPNAITAKQYILSVVEEFDKEVAGKRLEDLCVCIGETVARMHSNNIIHGDLTTSNILVKKNAYSDNVYDVIMIDFGLSHYGQSLEDKAVDLYVLERVMLSTHSEHETLFDEILTAYRNSTYSDLKPVLGRLEEVRARGRKRNMEG